MTQKKLVYYWDAERDSYIEQFTQAHKQAPKMFDKSWEQLEALMPTVRETLPPALTFHAEMEEMIQSVTA